MNEYVSQEVRTAEYECNSTPGDVFAKAPPNMAATSQRFNVPCSDMTASIEPDVSTKTKVRPSSLGTIIKLVSSAVDKAECQWDDSTDLIADRNLIGNCVDLATSVGDDNFVKTLLRVRSLIPAWSKLRKLRNKAM